MMDDDQQFCLRWNNHQSTLISVFDTLLENGTLVDCTLAAEGQFLKAHKVVLSACSPYFANLLKEQYDKHPIFILKDVKYQELRAMMDYMYRGEVNISQDQLAALLKAAESLQIKGLSDNRSPTSGQQHQQQQHQKLEQHQKLNVPGNKNNNNSGGGGYTLEQTKRPRIGPLSVDSQDINREGSSSPTSRKRKKMRRRSVENVMDNHEHSNSSAHSIQQINSTAPMTSLNTSGTSAVVSALQSSSNTQQQTSINISKKTESVLNTKQNVGGDIITTGTTVSTGNTNAGTIEDDNQNDNELIKPITKKENNKRKQQQQQHDKDELLLEPKNEYDDVNETIEDLTEDPDDDDIMDEDIGQAGPSHHGGEGSSQGFSQWPADRSQDEFIMAAQDQGQQRDPQVKHDKSEQTDMTPEEFELDDCLLESNDIVITQNKDGFVLHVKKLGNITSSKQLTADEEQQQQQQQQHIQEQQQQQQHHHHQQHHHISTSAGVVAVPGVHHQLTSEDNQVKTLTNLHTIKLPSSECELINLKKIVHQPSTSQHIHHQSGIATATIIQQPQHLQEHQHTTSIVTNQQTINTLLGLREVNIQPKNIISGGSRIKYSRGKYASPIHDSAGNTIQIVSATSVAGGIEQHHQKQESGIGTTTTVMAGEKKFEIAEIDLNNPQASIISDLVKYAEIDDIELPDGTKIGIGFAPADITEHHIQTTNQQQTQQIQIDEPNSPDESQERSQISGIVGGNSGNIIGGGQQEQTITKSYTILTTTPMKQQQQTTTTTTTTYELSLSDSSMTQSEDNEKLYMCRHCGKKYRWKSTLRRHENVECGGKEPCHPCPYCTYKAKQRGNLGVHVRKHHPEKPQLESKRGRKTV